MVRKFDDLYIQETLVLTKSFVRPYVRPPLHVSRCEMAHFDTSQVSKAYTTCVKLRFAHPCYGQSCQKMYSLTSVTWLYRGLRYTTHFLKLSADPFLVFNWSRAGVQFLKLEFILLSAYSNTWITWVRYFLKHPSRPSQSTYYILIRCESCLCSICELAFIKKNLYVVIQFHA